MLKINKLRFIFVFVWSILFVSCSSNVNKGMSRSNIPEGDFIIEEIDKLSKYSTKNDSIISLLQNKIDDYEKKLLYLDSKIENIDSYVFYIDSIHSNISNSLLVFQDNINLLRSSYSEISEVSSLENIKKFPPIDDEEFKDRYLSSLTLFQNGEWEKSIEGFSYLLNTSSNNSLLDNCQYWVGEIYFKMKKYHLSIKEFKKVFLYMDSNKRDDSLYKIAKSYILLNDELNANISLNDLIENYPNSEYVKQAKELLK